MKQATPQLSVDRIVLILVIATFSIFLGVLYGTTRIDKNLKAENMELKETVAAQRAKLNQQCNRPTGVIDSKFILNTVSRNAKAICENRRKAGL